MSLPHWHLALGVLGAFLALLWVRRKRRPPALRYPGLGDLSGLRPSLRVRLYRLRPWLQATAVLLALVALARPRAGKTVEVVHAVGVDIMVALDVSGSMAGGRDLRPNRLAVAKRVLDDFVAGRKHDRIGVVVFAGAAFTRCPLTLDYDILGEILRTLDERTVSVDGTAIGTALAASVSRLRESEARSRVVILLTDGANNAGAIAPEDAADMAKKLGVKVYTIGVGSDRPGASSAHSALSYLQMMNQAPALDEPLLRKLAAETGGRYFRATDAEALEGIFQIIDRLEASELEGRTFTRYRELGHPLIALALGLLLLDLLLGMTLLEVLP